MAHGIQLLLLIRHGFEICFEAIVDKLAGWSGAAVIGGSGSPKASRIAAISCC
jgi:hypothetical protein